jgi:hypothetical protein
MEKRMKPILYGNAVTDCKKPSTLYRVLVFAVELVATVVFFGAMISLLYLAPAIEEGIIQWKQTW